MRRPTHNPGVSFFKDPSKKKKPGGCPLGFPSNQPNSRFHLKKDTLIFGSWRSGNTGRSPFEEPTGTKKGKPKGQEVGFGQVSLWKAWKAPLFATQPWFTGSDAVDSLWLRRSVVNSLATESKVLSY